MIFEEDLKQMEISARPDYSIPDHRMKMACELRGKDIIFLITEYRKLKTTTGMAADLISDPIVKTVEKIVNAIRRTEKTLIVGKNTKLTIIEEKSLPAGTIIIDGAMPIDTMGPDIEEVKGKIT